MWDRGLPVHGVLLRALVVLCALVVNVGLPSVQAAGPSMVAFSKGDQSYRGIPIMDFSSRMVILGRDGQIHKISGANLETIQELDDAYQPATTIEMRGRLQKEFGRDFEVITTKHFLVVQPRGRGRRWPDMFESCHRSFISYMSRRGIEIRRGSFPMVAVVMPDSVQMYREMERMEISMANVSGVYSQDCNRVITHDGGHLKFIASTVRHEAAHQSAYNYNVHSRVVYTPRWVTEGIGQLFEPESMVRQQSGMKARDRVNQISLRVIREKYQDGSSADFAARVRDLVGSDLMFQNSKTVEDAYSISWAVMFYLAERDHKTFAKVLGGTNARGTYQPYDRFARVADFERWVGEDIESFSKKVAWFLKSL